MTPAQQRTKYGFWVWQAGGDDALPAGFVDTVVLMQGSKLAESVELPDYYRQPTMPYIVTGVAATDAAAAKILDDEQSFFPWTAGPPMLAVDGRLLQYILGQWSQKIEDNMALVEEIESRAGAMAPTIGAAKRTMYNLLGNLLRETMQVVEVAHSYGVPLWSQISSEIPESGGGFMPTYVKMPSIYLEDWAALYVDSERMANDAMYTATNQEPTGVVIDYAAMLSETEGKRTNTVPIIIGITAIGMTTVGMFLAVTTGVVGRRAP